MASTPDSNSVEFPPTKGQWKCKCGWTNHELRVRCRNCLCQKLKPPDEYLTAEQVMSEVLEIASPPVMEALRITYEGKFGNQKGKIPDVVLRDLALEPVTVYRRTCPKDDAPIYKRAREKEEKDAS